MGDNNLEDGRGTWLWIGFDPVGTPCTEPSKKSTPPVFVMLWSKTTIKVWVTTTDEMKVQIMSRYEF